MKECQKHTRKKIHTKESEVKRKKNLPSREENSEEKSRKSEKFLQKVQTIFEDTIFGAEDDGDDGGDDEIQCEL